LETVNWNTQQMGPVAMECRFKLSRTEDHLASHITSSCFLFTNEMRKTVNLPPIHFVKGYKCSRWWNAWRKIMV